MDEIWLAIETHKLICRHFPNHVNQYREREHPIGMQFIVFALSKNVIECNFNLELDRQTYTDRKNALIVNYIYQNVCTLYNIAPVLSTNRNEVTCTKE